MPPHNIKPLTEAPACQQHVRASSPAWPHSCFYEVIGKETSWIRKSYNVRFKRHCVALQPLGSKQRSRPDCWNRLERNSTRLSHNDRLQRNQILLVTIGNSDSVSSSLALFLLYKARSLSTR